MCCCQQNRSDISVKNKKKEENLLTYKFVSNKKITLKKPQSNKAIIIVTKKIYIYIYLIKKNF